MATRSCSEIFQNVFLIEAHMNLDYWCFCRWPFERSYAWDRFFFSPLHEEAVARLMFLVEEFRRTGVVSGPAGTGKTYLLKIVQQQAERLGRFTFRCDATGLDGAELISQIAQGCLAVVETDATTAQIWSALQTKFAAKRVIDQAIVLIIDHVDLFNSSCLQTICRLRQMADSIGLELTLILSTRETKIPPALHDLIELSIDIAPFNDEECRRFITSSIQKAGLSQAIFTSDALSAIHDLTNGVPAHIVTLCNLSLLATMSCNEKIVTSEYVEAAASEMLSGSDRSKRTRHPREWHGSESKKPFPNVREGVISK